MLDLLSDVLSRLNIRGTLYFRTAFTPPWGLEVPPYENVARFHFAVRGNCLVRVALTDETLMLEQGDLVIIPHGASHKLFSENASEQETLPLDRVLQDSGYSGDGVLVHGGGGGDRETQLICGHISFDRDSKHPIFDRLPPYIHIKDYGTAAGTWMDVTLRVIGEETGGTRAGGDLIALKMAEAIFAQSIRAFIEGQGSEEAGLSGFADPQISRALGAVHRRPAHQWTVEDLAREAGLSRTGFAQLFSKKMGMTPMQYVTGWRMQIARQALREGRLSVPEVAALAGYSSESAFARAFKNDVGMTPATYRRSR